MRRSFFLTNTYLDNLCQTIPIFLGMLDVRLGLMFLILDN